MKHILNAIAKKMTSLQWRVDAVRREMARAGVDAYIVYTNDPHASEYVPESEQRRQWISGFTGSAGTVVLTKKEGLLWTDGRYYTQAEKQLDPKLYKLMKLTDTPMSIWLSEAEDVKVVGYDPERTTILQYRNLDSTLADGTDKSLKALPTNLVDIAWEEAKERHAASQSPIIVQPVSLAGKTVEEKIKMLLAAAEGEKCTAVVLSRLDDIAWLFNLRGSDVDYNPVFIAYALVEENKVSLYIDKPEARLTKEAKAQLEEANVVVASYKQIFDDIGKSKKRIWIDDAANVRLYQAAEERGLDKKVHVAQSPCSALKAVKNETELEGFRNCHYKDAVALCSYLAWLDSLVDEGKINEYDEYTAAKVLDKLRLSLPGCVGLSFSTISALGSNGAIIHYAVEPSSARVLQENEIYLVDSGGQYENGTTDVTRTVWLGRSKQPSMEQRTVYTKVLQGHLALRRQRFPEKTIGPAIDCIARQYLWNAGYNYNHGTGHGVGHRLNVHEGPQRIAAPRESRESVEFSLKCGMVVSNEPGCYLVDKFGVRIENLVEICNKTCSEESSSFLGFSDLTAVPYDRRLIDVEALSVEEMKQINDYHAWCREIVTSYSSLVDDNNRLINWINYVTNPL